MGTISCSHVFSTWLCADCGNTKPSPSTYPRTSSVKNNNTLLYYTILYYTILYSTILYTILSYTRLYYIILYYTILQYIIQYYTILYHTILQYNILQILYYTILYQSSQECRSLGLEHKVFMIAKTPDDWDKQSCFGFAVLPWAGKTCSPTAVLVLPFCPGPAKPAPLQLFWFCCFALGQQNQNSCRGAGFALKFLRFPG